MRRQLEPSVLDGTLSMADLQKLLPSAEAVWHEPKHLPPRSQPKVSTAPKRSPDWLAHTCSLPVHVSTFLPSCSNYVFRV